jgi:hypothetical protein
MPTAPQDPFGKFTEGAAALHEFFNSLQEVGFNVGQALYLVGKVVEGSAKNGAGES